MAKEDFQFTKEEIRAIEAIMTSERRIELIDTKDGLKIYRVRRSEVKVNKAT